MRPVPPAPPVPPESAAPPASDAAASAPASLACLPSDLLILVADELVVNDDAQNFAAVCTRTLAAARVAWRATSSTPQAQVVRLVGRAVPSASRVQQCSAEGKLVGIKRLNLGELPRAPKAPRAPEAVDKVDAADVSDPQCIVPYLQDIHRHYREEEVSRPSLPSTYSPRAGLMPARSVAGAEAPLAVVHEQADKDRRRVARGPRRLAGRDPPEPSPPP